MKCGQMQIYIESFAFQFKRIQKQSFRISICQRKSLPIHVGFLHCNKLSCTICQSINITFKSLPIATLKLAVTDVTDLVFHFFSLAKKIHWSHFALSKLLFKGPIGKSRLRAPISRDLLPISVRFPGLGPVIYAKISFRFRAITNKKKWKVKSGVAVCFVTGLMGFGASSEMDGKSNRFSGGTCKRERDSRMWNLTRVMKGKRTTEWGRN